MSDHFIQREISLIIPMDPDMELTAAQTAAILAEVMDFEPEQIEEIQLALIETCINAFEHSKSTDRRIFITFTMWDDALELKISDHGIGFELHEIASKPLDGMRKRGWGLEIIRHMMDAVDVKIGKNGTTVTMVKNLGKKMPILKIRCPHLEADRHVVYGHNPSGKQLSQMI